MSVQCTGNHPLQHAVVMSCRIFEIWSANGLHNSPWCSIQNEATAGHETHITMPKAMGGLLRHEMQAFTMAWPQPSGYVNSLLAARLVSNGARLVLGSLMVCQLGGYTSTTLLQRPLQVVKDLRVLQRQHQHNLNLRASKTASAFPRQNKVVHCLHCCQSRLCTLCPSQESTRP